MAASEQAARHQALGATRRRLPGMPGVVATALATALVLVFLLVLLAIVTVNALAWFWPATVWELRLDDGSTVLGEVVGRETIPGPGAGEAGRIKLKVGNRDLGGNDFRWIEETRIVDRERPLDLVRIVRTEYGDAFGRIVHATAADGTEVDLEAPESLARLLGDGRESRRSLTSLQSRLERHRRPLTRLEERLDVVQRSARRTDPEAQAEIRVLAVEIARVESELESGLDQIEDDREAVLARLDRARLRLLSGENSLEIPLARVVEVVAANRMGWLDRVAHALRQGGAFLFTEPREANTEGGVFPALFGTVLMVLLMSVAVVPLGVITAVYMTEYASEGPLLRLANQAVNNLAGVPSIVFGMFGLAFFIYGVGGTVDRVFFSDRMPTPTFGTGGILWASLTLALLTVPVVVVATREALQAVPGSWREGSLALGATQWQTLRRIVLPAAMPGILTGFIMAVSRAAGEVAPLMLTGAVKLAPSLPIDQAPPFLHLQRKFMHLGFHIYDVSMQSPNVEAAKPMAFATTLVLLALVVLMNLTAIVIRRRLRRAYQGQAV